MTWLSNAAKAVANTARHVAGNAPVILAKHAPKVLVGCGIVGGGATVYLACKATAQSVEYISERDEQLENIEEMYENPEQRESDEKLVKKETRKKIVKAYLPAVTTGVLSVAAILGGYKLINGRYVASMAAYKTLETGYNAYREHVRETYGEEADQKMLYGDIQKLGEKRLETTRDENHEAKGDSNNGFVFYFDEYSERWQRYWVPYQVLEFLNEMQRQANDKLNSEGHLFLNDVLKILGLPLIPAGQLLGWFKSKDHSSKVDFGLERLNWDDMQAIYNAPTNGDIWVPLHIQPEGLIYTMI